MNGDQETDVIFLLLIILSHDTTGLKLDRKWKRKLQISSKKGYTENFGLWNVNFSDPARPTTAKQSVACYQEIVASNQIGPNIEQCNWKVDSLEQSEARYISQVAKMDYWERDEVLNERFNKVK